MNIVVKVQFPLLIHILLTINYRTLSIINCSVTVVTAIMFVNYTVMKSNSYCVCMYSCNTLRLNRLRSRCFYPVLAWNFKTIVSVRLYANLYRRTHLLKDHTFTSTYLPYFYFDLDHTFTSKIIKKS